MSNLAPDPLSASGISGKADRYLTASVGLVLDKTYSQQRFQLELTETAVRYEKFVSLDRNSFNYRGNWQWLVTPRVSGSISASRNEDLIGFDDAQGAQRVVRITTNRGASVEAWLFGGWYLQAGAAEIKTSSSQAFAAIPDSDQNTGNLGFRYQSPALGSITLLRRASRGTNQPLAGFSVEGGFTSRESEVLVARTVSGKTSLNGRLTWIDRRNENRPERDFSGAAGELGLFWTPTGRLTVNLSATRNIAAFFIAGATYRVEDGISVAPVWRLSPKTAFRMRADRRAIDYRGQATPLAAAGRHDILRSIEIGADWAAHPRATLGASLRRDERDSTDAASRFRANVATLNAVLNF